MELRLLRPPLGGHAPLPKGLKASIRSYGGKLRYNESVPYDYIVSYGTARTPSADYS